MVSITFISADGASVKVEANEGDNVKQVALDNNVDGITAECGGAMACATCHAIIDEAWADKVGPAGDDESEMLEFASCEPSPTSRLSCQVQVTSELDGMIVHLPESQV